MSNILLQTGLLVCLVISSLIVLILLIRQPLRKLVGAGIGYQLWAILPLSLIAMFFPHHQYLDMTVDLNTPVNQLIGGTTLLEIQSASVWPVILVSAWLIGSLAMLALFGMQHLHFLRRLGKLTRADGIYLASDVDTGPALAGCFRPKIIVPADFFERYSAAEQALIILHELVHKRRGDVIANTLFALLQCLFWFNPFVHVAARCFRLDQELACDASVIAQEPQARRVYAEAMLKTQLSVTPSALACHWPSRHPLKERIMQLQQNSPGKLKRISAYVVLSCLCGVSAYSAWAATPVSTLTMETKVKGTEAIEDGVSSDRYKVSMTVDLGGEKTNHDLTIIPGYPTSVVRRLDGQGGIWNFTFTLVPAPADQYKDAVTIDMVVKKGDEVIAKPKLVAGLNQKARLQKETPDKQQDFDISMTTNLLKKAE
ncbi:M56 family metallopeptidase [Undibacterium sp. Ji83W]|uniref:M56 family metallopeptidase n=1 Tax=Undibacterium sp. Ji83W TaxID=3413043 RepID=UPI003BF25EF3